MRSVLSLALVFLTWGWHGTAKAHGSFVVNTTADSDDGECGFAPTGDCSLREAIQAANAAVNDHPDAPDSIGFDFGPGVVGPFLISLQSPLPTITESAIIDGSSEPRYILGGKPTPVVVIDGGGFDQVFRVRAPNTLFVSLALTNAAGTGIDAESADYLLVRGCYFGIDPETGIRLGDDPQQPAFGSHAIHVRSSYRPRIGGDSEQGGNVIAGAGAEAILIEGGDDLLLTWNRIGVDPTGHEARPNCLAAPGVFAVAIDLAASATLTNNVISSNLCAALSLSSAPSGLVEENRIGVDTTGRIGLGNASSGLQIAGDVDGLLLRGNVISANGGDGVVCAEGATGQWAMLGNVIGIDLAASRVLPNGGHGVSIEAGCDGAAIGTTGNGQGNIIAHNQGAGIRASEGTTAIRGNAIFLNGELGIDAGETGVTANDPADAFLPVNFPEVREILDSEQGLVIEGCAVGGATIDVYEASADPSGFGEGVRHVGTLVEGGPLDADATIACSPENDSAFSMVLGAEVGAITLTSTRRGRTSEFSPVYTRAGQPPDAGCDTDASCEAPTPICNQVLQRCEACIDDAVGTGVDSGCRGEAPQCIASAAAASTCSAVVAEPRPREGGPEPVPAGGCSLTRGGAQAPPGPRGLLILLGLFITASRKKWAPNHINT